MHMERRDSHGFAWAVAVATLAMCGILVLGWRATAASDTKKQVSPEDCSQCHDCEFPSKSEPCLKEVCPRHKAMSNLKPSLGPSTVVLDELENLYEPVVFNHRAHAQMTEFKGGCETCHHFSPPDTPHPACKNCHPTGIQHEDIAQPGLKGAYHRNCMKCHQEWDKDTACEVCHAKKTEGAQPTSLVHRESHYKPIELKELILFSTPYAKGDQVPFHHRNHSQLYEQDCSECHQQQSCTRCHVQGQELHPMGQPEETDLHDTCFRCHDQEKCDNCHGRKPDDLFQHSDTGWPLRPYHEKLKCRACHGETGKFKKLTPVCKNCHPNGWSGDFNHDITGVHLDANHGDLDCGDCHVDGVGHKAACNGCHDDGRVYDKKTDFRGN